MDWNLWDPYSNQATQDGRYQQGDEWRSDFYFGYGFDVIEESVWNEKACIQVLKILITKADTEIVELEEDLVILQSQLSWLDEKWSESCSILLREKIDCLDNSIRILKNKSIQEVHDFGNFVLTRGEPAERIHDILQPLLRNYHQQKDKQSLDVITKESNSDHSGHTTDVLVEKKLMTDTALNDIKVEEVQETNLKAAEKYDTSGTCLKPPGMCKAASNYIKCEEVQDTNITSAEKHATLATFLDSPGMSKAASNTIQIEEVQDTDIISAEKHATLVTLLKSPGMNKAASNNIKSEDVQDTRIKLAGKYDTSVRFLKPAIQTEINPGTVERVAAIAKHSNLYSSGAAAGHTKVKRRFMKFGPELCEKVDGDKHKTPNLTYTRKSSLKSQVKSRRNLETVNPQPSDTCSNSILLADREALADAIEKLKQSNELNVGHHKTETSNSSLKHKKKRIASFRIEEERDADTEAVELTYSLLELVKHGKENRRKSQTKKERRPQQKAVVAFADDESNSNLSLNQLKRKHQFNTESTQELCLSDEISLNSSSQEKYKRQQNFKMGDKNTSFGQSTSETKKAPEEQVAQDVDMRLISLFQKGRKVHLSSPVLEGTKKLKFLEINLAKQHDGTRKVRSISPVLMLPEVLRSPEIDKIKMHDATMDGTTEKDLCIMGQPSTDSYVENAKSLSCPTVSHPRPYILDMDYLTVAQLKEIAKQQKLRGYHKLRKAELAQELVLSIRNRGEEKRKRKDSALLPAV